MPIGRKETNMSYINNENSMVYVVFKDTDYINIEAVFAKRESLQMYLEEQGIQFEESLNNDFFIPKIHREKAIYDEKYEITVKGSTLTFEVMYSELDTFIITFDNKPVKIWLANCICPFRQVKVFTTEENAKEWISNLDDPEEVNFIVEHQLL